MAAVAASKSELSYQFKILTGNLQILTSFVTHSKFICRASLLSTETQKGQVSAGFYSLAGLNPNQWPELPFRFRLRLFSHQWMCLIMPQMSCRGGSSMFCHVFMERLFGSSSVEG